MSAPVIAFFNNKGGVGKTSLVYHLAWMMAEKRLRVVAADLDPQANLTANFLGDDQLEELWPGGSALTTPGKTVYGSLTPLIKGVGDIAEPSIEDMAEGLSLLPGDLALSNFEDELSSQWPGCLDGKERAFRVISAFWRLLQWAATLRLLMSCWLTSARISARSTAQRGVDQKPPPVNADPYCLAQIKHHRSLMPLSYEARKPVFALKPADGAFGGHQAAVADARADFAALARRIVRDVGVAIPAHPQGSA